MSNLGVVFILLEGFIIGESSLVSVIFYMFSMFVLVLNATLFMLGCLYRVSQNRCNPLI